MEKRNVTKEGIKFKGQMYQAEFLGQYWKQQVQVEAASSTNDERIMVHLGDKFLGYATKATMKEGGHQDIDPEKTMGMADKVKEGIKSVMGLAAAPGSLEGVSTEKLIKELATRTGVSMVKMKNGQQYKVSGDHSRIKEFGPATVLVIRG
ncbi:BC1881 family protein [Anaerosolibacter sp.]|uniref:BC1881 family protein n=1 Tax=Anaerosolibacter sp. TaxID=1872527 RepID=UPI0039F0D484